MFTFLSSSTRAATKTSSNVGCDGEMGGVGQFLTAFFLTIKVRDIVKKTLVNDFIFFTVLFSTYTFAYIYIYVDDVIDALGCHRYVIKSQINAGQLNLGGIRCSKEH